MRNFFLTLTCLSCVLGCNLANLQSNNSPEAVDKVKATPMPTATPSPSPKAANADSSPKSGLADKLKKWVGKYPYEVKLLDEPELKDRLTKIVGKDFAAMKKYWNVETPIEVSDKILKTSGCEQHNCGANMYVMFVDLDNDNINVYHLNDEGGTKTYFEKGKITLPPKFAKEVETVDK